MAVNYKLTGGGSDLGVPQVGASDTSAKMVLGSQVSGNDFSASAFGEAEFRYVKFTATVAAGDFLLVAMADNTAVGLAGAVVGIVGIAMAAQVSGTFGWAMVRGVHDGANVATGGAAGNPLYSSATAGRATTTATATQKVAGAYLRVGAAASNVGVAELAYPVLVGAI